MTNKLEVSCPSCGTRFELSLDEALEQPIRAAVQLQLRNERDTIVTATEQRLRFEFDGQIKALETELDTLRARSAEAERAELQLRQERRSVEDERNRIELELERRLVERTAAIRETVIRDNAEQHALALAERDRIIQSMKAQVEELRLKSEQVIPQLRGEVMESEIESLLRATFPSDRITPVPAGQLGGDVLQEIIAPNGLHCGSILFEVKSTRHWSQEWLGKARADQRRAGAHVCVLVSRSMPDGVAAFDSIENVWVTTSQCFLPLTRVLRSALVHLALTRAASKSKDASAEQMFSYITGQQFRSRITAIVDACIAIRTDADTERKYLGRIWAKRDKHTEALLSATAAMYGDLQGLLGNALQPVDGLTISLLGDGTEDMTGP